MPASLGRASQLPRGPSPPAPPLTGAHCVQDVWEHAYYLDFQNRRPDFMTTFINELVCWDKVAERYAAATA
jgi:hypothetical protein